MPLEAPSTLGAAAEQYVTATHTNYGIRAREELKLVAIADSHCGDRVGDHQPRGQLDLQESNQQGL